MKKFLFFTLLTYQLINVSTAVYPEDYFSQGIEQYLKGDLEKAIESLQQALKTEPENKKAKEFSVKLLLEAGSRAYEGRDLKKALAYFRRARELAPGNKEAEEIYSLVREELQLSTAPLTGRVEKEKKETDYKETLARARRAKRLREADSSAEAKKTAQKYRRKKETARPAKPTRGMRDKGGKTKEEGRRTKDEGREKKRNYGLLFVVIGVILAAGLVIFGTLLVLQQANKNLQFRVEMEREQKKDAFTQLANLRKEKTVAERERGQEKEMLKRAELQLKEKSLAEKEKRILPEINVSAKEKESFIQQQTLLLRSLQEQFRKRSRPRAAPFDDPTLPEELPDERLLKTTLELYRINPESTLETLRQLTRSEDKRERLQAVLMLGELPTMDGAEIIMDLWNDEDYHVKRGVIKTLSKLDKIYQFPGPVHLKIEEELNKAKTEEKWIF